MKYKPSLQFGHSAFYKSKKIAMKKAIIEDAKIRKTKHFTRGKGYLVYK